MFVLWGKKKKLAKVTLSEAKIIYQIEMPPTSGIFYMPLVVDGRNKDEYLEVSNDKPREDKDT